MSNSMNLAADLQNAIGWIQDRLPDNPALSPLAENATCALTALVSALQRESQPPVEMS